MTSPAPARFGLIGTGWRSEFFARLARQAPDALVVAGVVSRRPERAAEVARDWGVPTFASVQELLATGPEFVIPCVPWAEMGPTTSALVSEGMAVLAETPPAADLDGLRRLWDEVGGTDLVQVAEQYLLMPAHAARLALARQGVIGDVTSVQVSSTHLYHAVSMIRGLLGVGRGPVTVHAQSFSAPLANPLSPAGWSGSAEPEPLATTLATLDFGEARMGLYDFTDNQWWNPLRARRIVVRGSLGEIVDEKVTRLVDPYTPVESSLMRRQAGVDLNLEGVDLQHISFDGRVVWRNAFVGARFSEDDLAVADLVAATAAWRRGDGPPPYPLAEACADHQISLAIGESIRTGQSVTTSDEGWSDTGAGAWSWPDGAVAVVTGAAGGVGHACAGWLAERGARVYSLDRRRPEAAVGTFVEVDVLSESSVLAAVQQVVQAAGRIDALVAAAGLSEEPTPAEEMGLDVWSRTIGVNLTGVFLTCQHVGRVMLTQQTGRIVTIASMSGAHVVNVPQQQVAYNASKGGLVAMTKSLAYEWAARGVRVNALSPGYVDTPLLGSKHDLHTLWKDATPLRRFAEPAEVAAAAGWLLSDEAAFCCGTELLMDGGYSLA